MDAQRIETMTEFLSLYFPMPICMLVGDYTVYSEKEKVAHVLESDPARGYATLANNDPQDAEWMLICTRMLNGRYIYWLQFGGR